MARSKPNIATSSFSFFPSFQIVEVLWSGYSLSHTVFLQSSGTEMKWQTSQPTTTDPQTIVDKVQNLIMINSICSLIMAYKFDQY